MALLGVAKGLVGLAVRPTMGLLEMTSKGTYGMGLVCLGREAISGSTLRRVRAPGALAEDSTEVRLSLSIVLEAAALPAATAVNYIAMLAAAHWTYLGEGAEIGRCSAMQSQRQMEWLTHGLCGQAVESAKDPELRARTQKLIESWQAALPTVFPAIKVGRHVISGT